jgi:hypothetical protein
MPPYLPAVLTKTPRFPARFASQSHPDHPIMELKIECEQVVKTSIARRDRSTISRTATLIIVAVTTALNAATALRAASPGSHVAFNADGIALVDGKPFFPIGVFTYSIDPTVLAELHEVRCNTVLHGFNPDQLNLLHDHGMMAVCETSDVWLKAAKDHPALLAWYLTDEPENRGVTADGERKRYLDLKARDPNHPIGLCHTSFEALTTFKSACDFTMTDIYPITKNRNTNVMGVSIMMDEARRIHGQAWPQWTDIQTFGGPESDNGVWAAPLPHEVRFMVYQALIHRATGILYFSYWPQQPRTWQSLATLNREVEALVPRLVAPGHDTMLKTGDPAIQARCRIAKSGDAGLIIAVNTTPKFVETNLHLEEHTPELTLLFEARHAQPSPHDTLKERFAPYEPHVYVWGPTP